MGIVSMIKTNCLGGCDQDKAALFLDSNGKALQDDHQFFQQQNWYRLQSNTLFDPNKFIFLYTHYKQTQQKLINHWKIVDNKKFKNNDKVTFNDQPLQPKWVYAIRKGVPLKFYKNIIQMMFSKNFNQEGVSKKYQGLIYQNMKKNGNKILVATFQQQIQDVVFSNPFLTKQGTQAAKKITFLLSNTHTQLQNNIYLIKLIQLLLIFVPQADTYQGIGMLIDASTSMSIQRQESLRWHISLTQNQFQKFARQFFKTVKDISPSIKILNEHLNTEGIDKIAIFREIIGDFFIGFLPFPVVLRIFIIFLNQGVKIFYRFFYAILKMTGTVIRDSSNTKQILRVIRTKMLINLIYQKQVRQFFRYAFDLQLENLLTKRSQLQPKNRPNSFMPVTCAYYLPQIFGDSQILSFQDIEVIWNFLPEVIKHYDIQKIFSTHSDNLGLKDMIAALKNHNITLIIVQTVTDSVFGVFMAQKLKDQQLKSPLITKSLAPKQFAQTFENNDSKLKQCVSSKNLLNIQSMNHFGSSENFLFTLRPKVSKYTSTGQNVYYCSFDQESFSIGGPVNQSALQLQTSLTQGLSYSSPTYCNDPLHQGAPGQFKIKLIQCFSIC